MAVRDGRLKKPMNRVFLEVNASIDFDRKLYKEDIEGSLVYAKALCKAGVLTTKELKSIEDGLKAIDHEIESGSFPFRREDEDIHMNIERRLFEIIGKTAHKLHTGRSRNEQVVLDERLYLIETTETVQKKLVSLYKALLQKAKLYLSTIVPSYTHLRQAQAISLSHLFLAYYHALRRDSERFHDFEKRLKVLPLGSGAVAGSSIGIDRDFLLSKLPFDSISRNSIDAVSTRDFIAEFTFICVSVFITLSRISEDVILFSSEEFGFYTLPDGLSTTSSLMPQKKNPDSLELIRGKTARIIGNLVSILTLMKGMPYTYNRDFQEDKEGLFDTVENTISVIDLMTLVIEGLEINDVKINNVLDATKGLLFATDIADFLVKRDVAFRDAHRIVGEIVKYATEEDIDLPKIPLEKYRSFHSAFDEDVFKLFDYIHSVNRHDVVGGTALRRIAEEIKRIEDKLKSAE